ncbi:unnamed protein product [Rotaria magnacalcarata]
MISLTTTTNTIDDNQYPSDVDQIGVKLRLIEKLFDSCQDLIKQSTSIDIAIENFTKNSNDFADTFMKAGDDLKCLCTKIISILESNRNQITITDGEEGELVNRDPGYYESDHHFTEEQLRYLVLAGPYQIRHHNFPKDKSLKAAKTTCMFTTAWLFGEGPGTEKKELAWISSGVKTWNKMKSRGADRKGKLENHFSSITHRSSVQHYSNFKTKNVNIDLMLDSNRRKANQEQQSILQLNKKVIVTLLDVARYLIKQGLAFRREPEAEGNFTQLINLLRRSNRVLDDWFLQTKLQKYQVSYLSKRSQDEYIQLLGAAIEYQVVDEINRSSFISVMVDSTPDLSHREMYSIVIRYTNNYQVKERLLSLQELASKIGEDICRLLLDTLSRKGISTDKIIGQCYDNAPNMSGIHKGVQACINKHLNREIMHIPCEAHTSNLVVEHSCKCSTEFVNLFMLLEEVYNLFSSSVKRYYVLRGALEKSTFGLTVKSLSDTRWNANYESLHCVVESYNEIIDCLELIESIESKYFDKETKAQAKNIKNKLISYEFVVLLKFMVNVTRTTNSLTIHLQATELDILSSLEVITNANKLIQKMRNDDEALKNILLVAEAVVEPFNIDVDQEFNRLYRVRQRSRRIDENPSTAVQLTREAFYLKLFRQILDHLYTAYNDYLQVLNGKLLCFHNLTPNRIQQLTVDDCKIMYKIVPGLSSEELLFTEFELLRDSIEQCENMNNVVPLLQKFGHLYPRVARVYNFLFTLPITTATNERCFSKLKFIKNKLRTTLKNEKLEFLIMCCTENDLLDYLDLETLANEWAQMKDPRIKISQASNK